MAHLSHPKPTRRFMGIDVSKATFDVAWWGDQPFQAMTNRAYARTPEGVRQWALEVPALELPSLGVVMESTGGYCKELAVWLMEARPGLHVAIANPFQVNAFGRSLGVRNKTDRVDARTLAKFGQERQPGAWAPESPAQKALQELTRTLAKFKGTRTAYRNRLAGPASTSSAARDAQVALLTALEVQIKALEDSIRDLCGREEVLRRDMALLNTIPGVGFVTAATLLGTAGDLRRFRTRGELCAFLGTSPRRFESGTSVQGHTHMCRVGGLRVRATLYMAALAASRSRGPIGDAYRRLVAAGKAPKSALGAVMRKLLTIMRAVLIQNAPYEPRAVKAGS